MYGPTKHLRVVIFLLLASAFRIGHAAPGAFSLTGLEGWQPQRFSRIEATRYVLVQDKNIPVLQAQCEHSASGYLWKEKVDLNKTPKLSWRWRVRQIYPGLRERDKSGDDFPARVYVVRDGGWASWRTRSLVYVWSNGESAARDWPSAYTAQAHVVVVRTGAKGLGQWQQEQRDLRADFKTYFGEEVDRVDAVALMTDCDDGKGSAQSEYGDIRLLP